MDKPLYYKVKFEQDDHLHDFFANDWLTLMSFINLWVTRYGLVEFMIRDRNR